MSDEKTTDQTSDATAAFDALAKAQQELMVLAKPLVGFKPVMKRLDLAMTALESANLWLSAALMALGELEKAVDRAAAPTMTFPPAK